MLDRYCVTRKRGFSSPRTSVKVSQILSISVSSLFYFALPECGLWYATAGWGLAGRWLMVLSWLSHVQARRVWRCDVSREPETLVTPGEMSACHQLQGPLVNGEWKQGLPSDNWLVTVNKWLSSMLEIWLWVLGSGLIMGISGPKLLAGIIWLEF